MEYQSRDVSNGSLDGQHVWICDMRYNDPNNKPVRHVKPQRVLVRSNADTPKLVTYYSASHFVVLKADGTPSASQTLGLVDNTGYRTISGKPVRIFDNPGECTSAYHAMCTAAIQQLEEHKVKLTSVIDGRIDEHKAAREEMEANPELYAS